MFPDQGPVSIRGTPSFNNFKIDKMRGICMVLYDLECFLSILRLDTEAAMDTPTAIVLLIIVNLTISHI